MKKLLLSLIAAIMAVAMCFGIAACSDNGGNDDKSDLGGTEQDKDNSTDKDKEENPNGGATEVVAKSITLSETTVTLELEGEKELTYTVTPAEAKVKVEVSDETVVKYENNKLTAVTVGTATVKVYSEKDETVSAQCAVTVSAPEGYKSVQSVAYRFIYPENWTKRTVQGITAYYYNSTTGANLNLVRSTKSDLTWTFTADEYADLLKTQYEQIGYTIKSIEANIKDDTYLGIKRRLITVDTQVTYLGMNMSMHQEQVALLSDTNCYILTITYTNNYVQSDLDLMISQFLVK